MAAYSLSFWKTILPHLASWREFDIEQRAAALELSPGYQTLPRQLAMLPADLLERYFEKDLKGRHRPVPEFRKLVDFVDRIGKWSKHQGLDTTIYVQQLTTYTQRHALTGIHSGSSADIAAAALERRMAEGWFVRQWLEKDSHDALLVAVANWMPEEVALTRRPLRGVEKLAEADAQTGHTGVLSQTKHLRGSRGRHPAGGVVVSGFGLWPGPARALSGIP